MKTKKIWLWSLVFGLVATVTFYVTIFSNQNIDTSVSATETQEPTEEVDAESESSSEVTFKQELLPFEEGKRAIALQVDEVAGVQGFIKPGSFVDLVWVSHPPDEAIEKGQHAASSMLLQNVKILGVGHAADSESEAARYQSVILEVTPYEGLALGFAKKDDLYIMLRSEGDSHVEPEKTHLHEDEIHKGVYKK
ncbi:Flp pilus assembly protein CpaB [Anaerobacillus sp. MEB173]|uniref:Flp pilus assembly protein CpaB n=1 Tax=Anaerobacillus sp. MEB173 TaxID=3383345 RepID=UPI003F92CCB1